LKTLFLSEVEGLGFFMFLVWGVKSVKGLQLEEVGVRSAAAEVDRRRKLPTSTELGTKHNPECAGSLNH
jgi:hypothetical protein